MCKNQYQWLELWPSPAGGQRWLSEPNFLCCGTLKAHGIYNYENHKTLRNIEFFTKLYLPWNENGGFQLEFVSISRVINQMTCYNSNDWNYGQARQEANNDSKNPTFCAVGPWKPTEFTIVKITKPSFFIHSKEYTGFAFEILKCNLNISNF